MKKESNNDLFKIKTSAGHVITATGDHPFYTKKGMVELRELEREDHLAINPFVGVKYEEPSDKLILNEENIRAVVGNREKLIKELKKRDLLPLRLNSNKFPILAKLVGFITGDGWLGYCYDKRRADNRWSSVLIGKKEDLIEIRKDIKKLGYDCNNLIKLNSVSVIKEVDGGNRTIKGISYQMRINSQSLTILFHALGVPAGNKSRKPTEIPSWVKKSPLWIKRLYLAGLFGAELSRPTQYKNEKYRFKEPGFSQNKIKTLRDSLRQFLTDIKNLLKEFGIKSNKIYQKKGVINKYEEETIKLSLKLSSKTDNLINLWSKIGFEYCEERKLLSMLALQYLKTKVALLEKVKEITAETQRLKVNGINHSKLMEYAKEKGVSQTQVVWRAYRDFKSAGRISKNFPTFNKFIIMHAEDKANFVWDEIESIEKLEEDRTVYDFTINHKDHNFIANNFVISNCGMRLIKTDLTIKEVQPKIKELVNELFKLVPAGVGCKSNVRLPPKEFKEMTEMGVNWALEHGFAWKQDLERIEDKGFVKFADSSKISERAIKRGFNQLGTLGSGNHYLEVQLNHASDIFNKEAAEKIGIHSDKQVLIMVHCGSRGVGHQIATDYLKLFDSAMQKYKIKIPDRELSCAPFNSDEGQDYYKAMACAANMAYANRQVITHKIRQAFSTVFKKKPEDLGMELIMDNTHNMARKFKYKEKNKVKEVLVHLKGATRSMGPGSKEVLPIYKKIGSMIVIGGSMETGSYLFSGTKKAEEETFATTAHGAGRTMSRRQAKREVRGDILQKDLEKRGIYIKAVSMPGLAEEAGRAYKDIDLVAESLEKLNLSKRVVKLSPIGNVKG